MDYCPPKAKGYKKKQGKCGCCSSRVIKRLPYATIANKTAASEIGAPISFAPTTGAVQVLWSVPALQPTTTCTNGPLRTWFDASNGQFTIQETGLYTITLTGDALNPSPASVGGYLTVRLGYALVNVAARCINSLIPPTGNHEFTVAGSNTSTASTVSATLALVIGDVITFEALSFLAGVTGPQQFFFEIDVVQHSRLDKAKVEGAVFA